MPTILPDMTFEEALETTKIYSVTGLLETLCIYAAKHGYSKIRLDVIDINDGARRLYESLGFIAISTDYHEYLHRYIGFYSSTTMVKELK